MTVRTGLAAGAAAREWIGRAAFHEMCKAFTRGAVFNVEPSTSATAIQAWEQAHHQHPTHDPEAVPAFVPVFLNTHATAEHVCPTVGRDHHGHRLVVTTDGGPGGTIALVRLSDLAASWGPVIGWTEDLDGQRVWDTHPFISIDRLREAALHEGDEHGDPPLHPDVVGVIERALVAERLLAPRFVNGYFGPRKRRAYAAWQTRAGYTGTGIPTLADASRLGVRHGFDVR